MTLTRKNNPSSKKATGHEQRPKDDKFEFNRRGVSDSHSPATRHDRRQESRDTRDIRAKRSLSRREDSDDVTCQLYRRQKDDRYHRKDKLIKADDLSGRENDSNLKNSRRTRRKQKQMSTRSMKVKPVLANF